MTVNAQGLTEQKYITTGDMVNSQFVVVSGLEEGDRVITIGQQKLQSGMPVNVNEINTPDSSASSQKTEEGN